MFLEKIEEFFENLVPHEHTVGDEPAVGYCEATVKKGDSLWRIAEKITGDGSRWHEIAALNPGLDKDHTLQVGEVLKLPKEWTEDD